MRVVWVGCGVRVTIVEIVRLRSAVAWCNVWVGMLKTIVDNGNADTCSSCIETDPKVPK